MRTFDGRKINQSYESAEESSSTNSEGTSADQSYDNLSFGPQSKITNLLLPKPNQSMTEDDNAVIPKAYIENKIKILLNQEDALGSDSSISDQNVRNAEKLLFLEDSCNAVDHKLNDETAYEQIDMAVDLSFNGKICGITSSSSSVREMLPASKDPDKLLNESLELLTKENSRMMAYENEKSPDLFADDDDDDENDEEEDEKDVSDTKTDESFTKISQNPEDLQLLKRIKDSLKGVSPPPSVTEYNKSIDHMLSMYQENKDKYTYKKGEAIQPLDENDDTERNHLNVYKNCPTGQEIRQIGWPQVAKYKAHGLYLNNSNTCELYDMELLPFVKRYISKETSSSFIQDIGPSSARKRILRMKMLNQSPGSRLSHLAKRRATFSSSNLLSNPSKLCNKHQIMIDTKKSDNRRKSKVRTPKRRTPAKKRTPRSSQKKRALTLATSKSTATVESSKRALFLSPERLPKSEVVMTSESSHHRGNKSRRVLFSPPKPSIGSLFDNNRENLHDLGSSSALTASIKRKRAEDEENGNSKKLRRMDSIREEDLTPRSLKLMKSQSFCVATGSSGELLNADSQVGGKPLYRSSSEMVFAKNQMPQLSENHKKKILWAVSQALQAKQITVKHQNFKHYASNLAKIVKKIFLEFNDVTITSTSEKLLKLANKYVFEVTQGKTADQIYAREKVRIVNLKNSSKLSGYIAPEEYERRKLLTRHNSMSSVDNSVDSFSSSRLSQVVNSQSLEYLNQLNSKTSSSTKKGELLTALRENIDSEQRQRSGQKQVSFTGLDDQIKSPFADKVNRPLQPVGGGNKNSSILKAKRQISFE